MSELNRVAKALVLARREDGLVLWAMALEYHIFREDCQYVPMLLDMSVEQLDELALEAREVARQVWGPLVNKEMNASEQAIRLAMEQPEIESLDLTDYARWPLGEHGDNELMRLMEGALLKTGVTLDSRVVHSTASRLLRALEWRCGRFGRVMGSTHPMVQMKRDKRLNMLAK